MANKWAVDHWVEGRANSLIKSFYPTIVARETELSLELVYQRLCELAKDEKLVLKWEVRCPECHFTIDILDNFPLKNEGETIECDRDGEIELSFDIIYPVFQFSPEYRNSILGRGIQKKKSLKRKSVQKKEKMLVLQV
jgi:hypothetical protein